MKLLKILTPLLLVGTLCSAASAQEVVKFDNPYLQTGESGRLVNVTVMEYYYSYGKCPDNNASLGLPEPSAMANEFIQKITVQGCKIEVILQNKAPVLPALRNKKLVKELVLSTEKFASWVCSGDDYNPYLWEACSDNPVQDALVVASAGKLAIAEYYASQGECPTDNKAVGFGEIETANIKSMIINGCKMTSQIRESAPVLSQFQGKKVELTGVSKEGIMWWTCKTDLDDKYRPEVCQKL